MKRFLSLLMAVALLFTMGITAFAVTDGTGSITITNATVGDTYSIYKIFDASMAVDKDGNLILNNGKAIVSYSIDKNTNQFFNYMFGAAGTAGDFFSYNANTGAVTRKEGVTDSAITDYLKVMVQDYTKNYATAAAPIVATGEIVKFEDLSYGYYLIDKGNGAAVTIDSNTPDAEVIDKTQEPGNDFAKWVWDEEVVIDGVKGAWVKDTSANIGDVVNFKVEFDATNFDGGNQIKYYTVKDTKGEALWVEFNTITVKVGDEVLSQGYYHSTSGEHATEEWEYLGTWTDEKTPDNAQWYLIHYGFDEFDIVIPWMTGHDFTGTTNGFTIAYGENAQSHYDSPVDVVITYDASVEPGATIGTAQKNNLWNTADLSWTSTTTDGPDDPSTTTITTYALGLNKIDADTGEFLEGAVFEVYRDAACLVPVYVIPTNIKGVYILDDLDTIVSGKFRETSRVKYAAYLDAYLQGARQKNVVASEANGKLVILGLEAGTYYLKETKAPNGYNTLPDLRDVIVGQTNNSFFVVADENGNVVNKQEAEEGYTKYSYTATSTTVENSKGLELPSTGGTGTMLLITIGSIVALAFAVLLITHKKMSVYAD